MEGTRLSTATNRRSLRFFSFREEGCNTGYFISYGVIRILNLKLMILQGCASLHLLQFLMHARQLCFGRENNLMRHIVTVTNQPIITYWGQTNDLL